MKLIYLFILIIFASCENSPQGRSIDEIYPIVDKVQTISGSGIKKIRLYEIDSCEYVGYIDDYYTDFLTHKGNCKFCEQRKKY